MINQKKGMLIINVTEVLNYMCPVKVVIEQDNFLESWL